MLMDQHLRRQIAADMFTASGAVDYARLLFLRHGADACIEELKAARFKVEELINLVEPYTSVVAQQEAGNDSNQESLDR